MGGITSRYDLVRLDVVDDEPDVRFVGALVDDEGRFGLPAVRPEATGFIWLFPDGCAMMLMKKL